MRYVMGFLLFLAWAFPVQAFDCEFYSRCCWEYVGAIEEAGSPPFAVQPVADACTMHLSLPPSMQHAYCFRAWEEMSMEIWEQYQRGIIAFYPESCLEGVDEDPEWVEEPDPSIPEPDHDEELEGM